MRVSLPTCVFMSLMAATPPLFAAEVPEPFLPKGVMFGMTCDAVRAARPNAFKPDIPILPLSAIRAQLEKGKGNSSAGTTLETLMDAEVKGNPVVIRHFYFPDRTLAAVMYTSAYSILPEDEKPLFQNLRELLDKNFKKQADERIVRLSEDGSKPEERFVESWKDPEDGSIVLFDAEDHALRCIIYDPRVYSKADFYMNDGDTKILEPTIRSMKETLAKRTPEEVKAEKERQENFERMRQEARKRQQNALSSQQNAQPPPAVAVETNAMDAAEPATAPSPRSWFATLLALGTGMVAALVLLMTLLKKRQQ